MYVALLALFILSATAVVVLSQRPHPKYFLDAFALVSWLILALLVIAARSR
jgi:hypothetical protein